MGNSRGNQIKMHTAREAECALGAAAGLSIVPLMIHRRLVFRPRPAFGIQSLANGATLEVRMGEESATLARRHADRRPRGCLEPERTVLTQIFVFHKS
jgi:hypothetical protein